MSKYPHHKPRKDSLIELTQKYANNPDACRDFFFQIKWPTGYVCPQCGCTNYCIRSNNKDIQCNRCKHKEKVLTRTLFQGCKLSLYKLILGLYLFFTANKGKSAVELASELDINYKTALRLSRRCRVLMEQSNSEKKLNSMFYECDVANIGTVSKGKPGVTSMKQPVSVLVSTKQRNQYPELIKLCMIKAETKAELAFVLEDSIVMGRERELNTDGKRSYDIFQDNLTVINEKITYKSNDHRLKYLNIFISNLQSTLQGIYHGIGKRDMYLFLQEFEWRTNHRKTGKGIMAKVAEYLAKSKPKTNRQLCFYVDTIFPFLAKLE